MVYEHVPDATDNEAVLEDVPVSTIICNASSPHVIARILA
jgi:hypothetical protein